MSEKRLVYYRISRLYNQKELEMCSEEIVKASLGAWSRDLKGAMAKIRSGIKVATPYAYYIAKPFGI